MTYQLQFNLQQRAALSTAILFWEQKEVKKEVKAFYEYCGKLKKYETEDEFQRLTVATFEKWNKYALPPELKAELIRVVKEIGRKIFNWYQYNKYENESQHRVEGNTINYIDKIFWTPYSTIHDIRVLKSSWLDNSSLNASRVYSIVYNYALQGYLNDLWQKIPKNIQDNYCNDTYYYNENILVHWKNCTDGDLLSLMTYFKTERISRLKSVDYISYHDQNSSAEEKALQLTGHGDDSVTVEYFWRKLMEQKGNQNVLEYSRMAVIEYNHYKSLDERTRNSRKEKYVKICIFLMNRKSRDRRELFLNKALPFSV